jgi:hypothetical protein
MVREDGVAHVRDVELRLSLIVHRSSASTFSIIKEHYEAPRLLHLDVNWLVIRLAERVHAGASIYAEVV